MDYHTDRINRLYRLSEAFWPNFYSLTDDDVLAQFCYYSEHRLERYTEHEHQARLFMYWHEIEVRGLYAVSTPETGTFAYPWERDDKLPFDLTLPYDATRPLNMETFAESVAYGCLGGPKHTDGGRKGKVGFNNTPDEENMGLYRRERKDR